MFDDVSSDEIALVSSSSEQSLYYLFDAEFFTVFSRIFSTIYRDDSK